MARLAALPVACLLACNGAGHEGSGFSISGVTSVTSPASTGEGSSTSTGAGSGTSTGPLDDSTGAAASSTGSTTTTGSAPDQGAMPDFGDKPVGCKGKIDFLFSISSDDTMEDAQARLKASFPGFLATIEQDFADFDSHIMVANTGGLIFFDGCEGCQPECPVEVPEGFPCAATFDACDKTTGAGVTFPTGLNASNKRCDMYGQYRYIRQEHPNPLATFTCIASVGTSGANTAVTEHALDALSDDMKACNYGFLRDDALLVLTIITDFEDYGSDGQPPDWTKALLVAKGGDPDASVVLLVMPDSDLPDGVCKPYLKDEFRLRAWSELLPHVRTGSACAPSYAPFFADAAALVKQQCESFIPG